MDKFIINGGKPLRGTIKIRGAKNAVFPILVASLLTKKQCIIYNLPLIEDVFRMVEILESLGARIAWPAERTLKIRTARISLSKIKKDLISKLRGSVLFYGPLLARFGEITLPQPGGCVIGARPIDTHMDAFLQLGAKISSGKNLHNLKISKTQAQKKERQTVILGEFSVTATENIILFASGLARETIIKGADIDYPTQELVSFLKKMGARIKIGSFHEIGVEGSGSLKGAEHQLIYDPIEAGTFILAAAATRGDVTIENVEVSLLELFLKRLKDAGLPIEILAPKKIRVRPWKKLSFEKIQSLPYPGIATDLLSAFGVLATQAEGSTLIHDTLYEGRFKYLEEINKMGAKIFFCDPHRVIINGPTPLVGRELGPLDLRGGAALIIAGLAAKGRTVIDNVYQIDRGYEQIEKRLRGLGADIERIK